MLTAALIIWPLVIGLLIPVWQGPPNRWDRVWTLARRNGAFMATRMPVALLAAGFLAPLLPTELIAQWLGGESGWTGLLIASAIGIAVPSGPIMSFPLALALSKAGVGAPQLIAFITSWSLLSATNALAWDVPILGLRFTAARYIVSMLLPVPTGYAAALILGRF